MKKSTLGILLIVLLFACQKQVDYMPQINALNASISSLQKSRDSLASALALTNANLNSTNANLNITNANILLLTKSVDSIKTQLILINAQISVLTKDLASSNANITLLASQIEALNKQYAALVLKLNEINNSLSLYIGLVSFYSFAGNANDIIDNGNNGTAQGAILTNDRFGISNSAYNFNGTNSYIKLAKTFFDGAIVSKLSYSIWFKIDNYPETLKTFCLTDKNSYWRSVQMAIGSNGSIAFWWTYPNPQAYYGIYSGINSVPLNKWNNYTVVLNGNTLNAYLNGNLITITTQNSNNGLIDFSFVKQGNSTSTNIIGAENPASGFQNFFKGQIDDFRIYNRALSQAEITFLSNN